MMRKGRVIQRIHSWREALRACATSGQAEDLRHLVCNPDTARTSTQPSVPSLPIATISTPSEHGTCERAVQANLRWGCDDETSNKVCCFNRHYAEHSG